MKRGWSSLNCATIRLGKRTLRGLRLIHTHLRNEHISEDDITDLSLLRLDLLAALLSTPGKQQIFAQLAWLSPSHSGPAAITGPVTPLERIDLDFTHFIAELEADLERSTRAAAKSGDALERAILISVTTTARARRRRTPLPSCGNWPAPPGSRLWTYSSSGRAASIPAT